MFDISKISFKTNIQISDCFFRNLRFQPAATSRVLGGGEKKLCHAASRPSGIYTTYLVGWYSYSTARAICQANSEIFSCLLFGPPAAERKKVPVSRTYRRAGACIFAQCIKKVRRDGRLCPPAENPVFSEIYGEFGTSKGRKAASAPTVLLKFSGGFVGVDAYIDPAVQTDFTEIHGEFATFSWGDVGIAPYACLRDFRVSRR